LTWYDKYLKEVLIVSTLDSIVLESIVGVDGPLTGEPLLDESVLDDPVSEEGAGDIEAGGPWCVLLGKLEEGPRVAVLRGGERRVYPLESREPFERFRRAAGLDAAERWLADNSWAGCYTLECLLREQPGLLAYFTGDFELDEGWGSELVLVSTGVVMSGTSWRSVVVWITDSEGHRAHVSEATGQLLAHYPRLRSEDIESYDLRNLVESGIVYIDSK
jgi:hypothetical protein